MTTENRFKVGDRVRCADAEAKPLVDGAVYEVTSVVGNHRINHCINVRPVGNYHPTHVHPWAADHFVPATEGINVGDTVRVVEEHWGIPPEALDDAVAVGCTFRGRSAIGVGSTRYYLDPTKCDVVKRAGATETTKGDPEPEADETLESFKLRVWEAAQAAKKEHGWCSEIDKIVADLGVTGPTRRYRITIPVEIDVTGVDLRGTRQLRHRADVIGALRNLGIERPSSAEVVESSLYTAHWKIEEIAR